MKKFDIDWFMVFMITLIVILVGLLVWVIVAWCNGSLVTNSDSNDLWLINPANPASPVHQALF